MSILFCTSAVIIGGSCSEEKEKSLVVMPRDTTITNENLFSPLNLDSGKLEDFIALAGMPDTTAVFMRNFYNARNFHFAWITEDGIAQPMLAS